MLFRSVEQHKTEDHPYTVEMNHFGDLSSEEFVKIYNGLKYEHVEKDQLLEVEVDTVGLPATVDWVKEGAVTAVKNQGQCGSCWSFSTSGSVEGVHFLSKQTGGVPGLVGLSEKQLMDCSGSFGNQACNGGLMDNAFKYLESVKGLDTESSYPYYPQDGTCHYNPANIGACIQDYQDVVQGSEASLQKAVAQQPVSVAIDASHQSFQFYSGGVYYEPNCSSTQLDHGVLAVGYGTLNGNDYWLVKNSWSASWGEQGYIMMSRNRNNNCGIATSASFPLITSKTC